MFSLIETKLNDFVIVNVNRKLRVNTHFYIFVLEIILRNWKKILLFKTRIVLFYVIKLTLLNHNTYTFIYTIADYCVPNIIHFVFDTLFW